MLSAVKMFSFFFFFSPIKGLLTIVPWVKSQTHFIPVTTHPSDCSDLWSLDWFWSLLWIWIIDLGGEGCLSNNWLSEPYRCHRLLDLQETSWWNDQIFNRGARLQSLTTLSVAIQHVAPERMCASSLKWSGRLSHWARRSWNVTFPPILKHLWRVLLIFNPLKNTCSFAIYLFGFSLNTRFELKPWDVRGRLWVHSKRFSSGKSVEPKLLYSVYLLNHPAKKKELFSSCPTEATHLF